MAAVRGVRPGRRGLQVLTGLTLLAGPAGGQSGAGPPGPARTQPCTAPEFRQFDFWIGDWEVRDTSGTTVYGSNRIESILGGCALQEHWTSATPGQSGTSFNIYYPPRRLWHQTWVDSSGGFLLLDGRYQDGAMRLSGTMPRRDGVMVRHRINWSR